PAAQASQIVSTSSVTNLVLGVNAKGEAMLTYVSRGRTVHVLAWGALNALPSLAPTAGPGEALDLAYDGGCNKCFRRDPAALAPTTAGAYTTHSRAHPPPTAALDPPRELQAQMTKATASADKPTRRALSPRIAAAYAALARIRHQATEYWRTFTCPAYGGPLL